MRSLWRRLRLTLTYERPADIVLRAVLAPVRLTPRARRLGLQWPLIERRTRARAWRARHRPAVAICPVGAAAPGAGDVLFTDGPSAAELACLQYTAHTAGAGVVGPRLIGPDGAITHAGLAREDDRFVPCYAGRPASYGPATVRHPVLAVAGEGMFVRRELLSQAGPPDLSSLQGAVDYCRRAWELGYEVLYEPAAVAVASVVGEARAPIERRQVGRAEGRLRIVYVTQGTGLWGGHRVIFDDINALADRGHDVSLFSLELPPDWYDLRAPVRTFGSYAELERALAPLQAIKVATWWRTATPVWRASVTAGIPVYLVQDIESSYYPDGATAANQVLATYRSEFAYLTTSGWNRDRLAELERPATVVAPAVRADVFRATGAPRREDMVLAIARDEPLKRFHLTAAAWGALPEPRPELCLFGRNRELTPPGARYVAAPTDSEVNRLLNQCTVFLSTSGHEGFALPPLEAMATGAAVVCTDAHGNRDYCRDGVNCLMPAAEPRAIAGAVERLMADRSLRERLGAAGIETAARYEAQQRARAVEAFMREVATGARPRAVPRA